MAFIAYVKRRREAHAAAAAHCAYCREEFRGRMPGCHGRCRVVTSVSVLPPYLR